MKSNDDWLRLTAAKSRRFYAGAAVERMRQLLADRRARSVQS
jgi:hypothetical protein